jgi:hypothetical protein
MLRINNVIISKIMELDFYTFDSIDDYNCFVNKQKEKGKKVIPVSVCHLFNSNSMVTIYFYYE